ncbi:NAD(P)H-dependent amine dehydrogenase family protein [Desulfoferrobacter suflitae]|uniref:NAD(P)H-dependent amine dehydrogenase family protein n=1 Tax=Desulfoferrobacter suflitae TaxID=2865782 RepID=UPI00216411C1|nr:hypothetical protein [Desulfoferrobacter suflitae]MCK8602519.1 hypothetical protein [Desulfoferrobacter suflitae]
MKREIRVIQYGIGPIGQRITAQLNEKTNVQIVGAIDSDPQKTGVDLGELAGLNTSLGVKVTDDSAGLLSDIEADVVVLTTTSTMKNIEPQIMEIVASGKNLISSCEELVYPWKTQPEIAKKIDLAAVDHRVSVLSTGVNPGFLMDFFPLAMTGICQEVRRIHVERIQDARQRRIPFQKKIGAGLPLEHFNQRLEEGVLRHVGLVESLHLLAAGMGWSLERAEDIISPVIASKPLEIGDLSIEPGMAAGVRQIGRGFVKGEEVITLHFEASIGEPAPRDRIVIKGRPDLDVTVKDGVNGDIATTAIIVNAIPTVINAAPGLRTMIDAGLISFWA